MLCFEHDSTGLFCLSWENLVNNLQFITGDNDVLPDANHVVCHQSQYRTDYFPFCTFLWQNISSTSLSSSNNIHLISSFLCRLQLSFDIPFFSLINWDEVKIITFITTKHDYYFNELSGQLSVHVDRHTLITAPYRISLREWYSGYLCLFAYLLINEVSLEKIPSRTIVK